MPNKVKTLADLGEDALVQEITAGLPTGRDVIAGAGDDCAVVKSGKSACYTLLKTDCVVERVHYLPDAAPSAVGYKAMARALSDIAAMGGAPGHALVTIVLEPTRTVAYVRGLYRGIKKAAERYGCSVVGGETARPAKGGGAMISVSLTGTVDRRHCCLRSGGRPGDALFVTGRLGGSLAGKHLRFEPRLAEATWLAGNFKPRAMMDLSDGLAADLPRLAHASGCGFELDPEALPRTRGCSIEAAMTDGEDYELLFAIPPSKAADLATAWSIEFPKLALTRIGALANAGTTTPDLRGGWTHF